MKEMMIKSELLDHWLFFEPKDYLKVLYGNQGISKEFMQLFYIARCLFSQNSDLKIKGKLSPLLERREIFPKEECRQEEYSEDISIQGLGYGSEKELNPVQKVYILFDNSSSMDSEKLNKLNAAKAICLEYLRSVQKESPQIFFRYFNQDMGPLIKITKDRQIKDLIKYVIQLNTYDCSETKVGEAILKAIEDIEIDPELQQAEILMITDGLGKVPSDIEKRLGKIKFHMVLIPGANIDQFLKKYPNKEAWGKVDITIKSADELGRLLKKYPKKEAITKADIPQELKISMNRILEFYPDKEGWGKANNRGEDIPPYWDIFLQLLQIYRLQEFADIFIKIPSLFVEKFIFSNEHELKQIKDLRLELVKQIEEGDFTSKAKYQSFRRINVFAKYLDTIWTKDLSRKLKTRVKEDLRDFRVILRKIMDDELLTSTLNTAMETNFIGTGKKLNFVLTESNKSWMVILILDFVKSLLTVPKGIFEGICFTWNYIVNSAVRIYRKQKLNRRFNYISR